MVVFQGRHVALVNEIFFGFDVVVQAGFGQAQAFSDIPQSGSPRPFVVKQFGCLRQNRCALGVVLDRAIEGRRGIARVWVSVGCHKGRILVKRPMTY